MTLDSFLEALRQLGQQAQLDLTPDNSGSYQYEFDDGLTCRAYYREEFRDAALECPIGRLNQDANQTRHLEMLLRWNGDPQLNHIAFISLNDDGSTIVTCILKNGDLEPDLFADQLTKFLTASNKLRQEFMDQADPPPSPTAGEQAVPGPIMG